jgi:hypothetical protein
MTSVSAEAREVVGVKVDTWISEWKESKGLLRVDPIRCLGSVINEHPGALNGEQTRRALAALVDAAESSLRPADLDQSLFVEAWEPLVPMLNRRLKHAIPAVDGVQLRRVAERLLALAEHPESGRIHPKRVWNPLRTLLRKRSDAFTDGQLDRVVALTSYQYKDVGENSDELVTITVTEDAEPLRQLAKAELRHRREQVRVDQTGR